MEQEALAAELLAEQAVVTALAIIGVADDGMAEVLQVTAKLVAATGLRLQLDQGVAAGRVATDRQGEFHPGQPPESGDRVLGLPTNPLWQVLQPVRLLHQRVIDYPGLGNHAT